MSDPKRNRNSVPSVPRRAVVVGGGIAGLLAARVLCDHFEEVVLAERDVLREGQPHRPGAPHAHHLHLLLRRGLMAIEQLFPGVGPDLEKAGSLLLDQGRDFHILYRSGWAPRQECGLQLRTFTRPLLEGTIRRHLGRHPQVRFLEGCDVTGLVPDGSGTGVAGVRYHLADTGERILAADLVVDASGRSSKAPEWLEALGYPAPEEAVVDACWGYASRDYEPPAGFEADWKVLLMMNRPPDQPRAGILEWVEGNRWMVTVAGVMGERPPADEEGFLRFIRAMASPAIWEALRQARPLSRIYLHHRTQNRLRSFDRLPRRPERFLVLGDAVCAFTPVYGQGMTVSALEALELGECLRRRKYREGRLDGLAADFQKRVARLVAGPWALATGEDLRWPATVGGEITPRVRFFHWYIDQVIELIPQSAEVFRRFQEVNHMLKPATALFHPAVLGPVLRQALRGAKKEEASRSGLLSHLLHLLDVLHLRPARHPH